jgi:hypothetical protein
MSWALLLLLASPGRAADLEHHGYVKAQVEVLPFEEAVGATARLQQQLSGGNDTASFVATFDLDLDLGLIGPTNLDDRAAELHILPVECYVTVHPSWFDLSAGKQYVFWGQTDWVNPTDLFTPWDYLHISSELEDYRIAPWALRFTAYVRDTSFDLVWVPLPRPDLMDFSMMADRNVGVGDPELPDRTLANGDFGLRIATRVAGFDLSAMAFHGLDKRPGMRMDVDTTSMPPILTLVPSYGTMQAVGGDFARGFGPVLLKGEAAYYRTEDHDGDDPAIRNPELYAVAGLTYVPHTNLNLTVQGTVSHLFEYDPEVETATRQAMGEPDPDVDPVTAWGLVERAAWTWEDLLTVSVVGVQGIPEGDHSEMVLVSWRAADGLTVLAGAVVFGGPEESRFGRVRDASRVFAEVKASF